MQRYITLFLFTLALSACWRNPNFQGRGEDYIQGEWKQDSVSMQKQLLSYSLYQYKFNCDSVFVTIHSVSKVNTGSDTCMNKGNWMEYIRGTYTQKHDTLHIKGLFCNADFSLKKEGGCFRSGVYEEGFKVSKKTDSIVQLSSLSNVIPVNLHLIKSITCNPKPL